MRSRQQRQRGITRRTIPDLRVGRSTPSTTCVTRTSGDHLIVGMTGSPPTNWSTGSPNGWTRGSPTTGFAAPLRRSTNAHKLWRLWRPYTEGAGSVLRRRRCEQPSSAQQAGEIDEPQFSIWLRHIANMQNELVADGALILKFLSAHPARGTEEEAQEGEEDPHVGWQIDERRLIALDSGWARCCPSPSASSARPAGRAPWTIVEATDSPPSRPDRRQHDPWWR